MRRRGSNPRADFSNDLSDNDLRNEPIQRAAFEQCFDNTDCLCLALDGIDDTAVIVRIARAWPNLEPHIRDVILTLIDASLNQQKLDGGAQQ